MRIFAAGRNERIDRFTARVHVAVVADRDRNCALPGSAWSETATCGSNRQPLLSSRRLSLADSVVRRGNRTILGSEIDDRVGQAAVRADYQRFIEQRVLSANFEVFVGVDLGAAGGLAVVNEIALSVPQSAACSRRTEARSGQQNAVPRRVLERDRLEGCVCLGAEACYFSCLAGGVTLRSAGCLAALRSVGPGLQRSKPPAVLEADWPLAPSGPSSSPQPSINPGDH